MASKQIDFSQLIDLFNSCVEVLAALLQAGCGNREHWGNWGDRVQKALTPYRFSRLFRILGLWRNVREF